jgi:hypothetical protein
MAIAATTRAVHEVFLTGEVDLPFRNPNCSLVSTPLFD